MRNFLFPLSIFLFPFVAHASIVFTEVMYDAPGADTSREWVEVQNTGSTSLTLRGWKLYEADTNHKISAVGEGMIVPGGYAVIVASSEKFKADWPNYAGVMYDSTFSLANTGETLVLKDASSTPLATLTYSTGSAEGDGNSLNDVNGVWVARKPSPGESASAEALAPAPVTVKVAPKASTKALGNSKPVVKVSAEPVQSTGAVALAAHTMPDPQRYGIWPWVGGVVALSVIGIAAAYFVRRPTEGAASYTITDSHE